MQNPIHKPNFKRLFIFTLASAALISSGFLMNNNTQLIAFILLMLCNICGIFLIYRLNDCVDQDADFKFNLKHFLGFRLHQIILGVFILCIIPLSVIYLSFYSLTVLAIASVFGVLYSLTYHGKTKNYRLKNIFFVKNVLIGTFWGSLVLVGSGTPNTPTVYHLFILVSIQVFIGSMIRDIPDIEKDRESGVKSFPVVLGIIPTLLFMHLVNILILFYGYLAGWEQSLLNLSLIVAIWRMINLIGCALSKASRLWSQTINLLTCVLIFILIFSLKYDSIF